MGLANKLLQRVRLAEGATGLLRAVLAGYFRLFWWTARVEVTGAAHRDRFRSGARGGLIVFCHGSFVYCAREAIDGIALNVIASRSKDGEIALMPLTPFGVTAIRGSSANPKKPEKDKGGTQALRASIAFLKDAPTHVLGITPDGPRGPRGRVKPGAAIISARTGAEVVPVGYSATWQIRFASWDRFLLPLPFAKVHVVWGDPLPAPTDSSRTATEDHRAAIEAALIAAQQEADRRAGQPLYQPAPDAWDAA
ncbi:hypothetical protein FHS89_002986 [Rubricella aquisinus]|uniref:DUF374 domain-containing protein n=1 Tax=Rubricella aquisinus TaxID=2028108 RepID=A0A840WTD7_9RHOB|nr:lysophospholipid acyltransferase family protein [Rubricella aquisinus]MBB5516942.1 hypothetical protein [Rubricella aquisinus]